MATDGSARRSSGSYAVRDDDRRKSKFPWWLLLLGLAALLGVLFFACGRDTDPTLSSAAGTGTGGAVTATEDGASSGATTGAGTATEGASSDESSGDDATGGAGSGGAATEGAAARDAAAAGGPGTLVVDGSAVLPGAANQIGQTAGPTATASQVPVESVVSDEGFWVGESESDRVFVRLRTDGESPFQVEAGQTVSFEGQVTDNPSDVEGELGVTAEEGADLLQEQGRHVEVDELQLDQEA